MSYPLISLSLARLRQEDLLREAAEAHRADLFRDARPGRSTRPILDRLAWPRLMQSLRGELGTTPTA